MAKAKKMPSGKWNIRVGSGTGGKTKSFTADTKREAELLAAEYLNGKHRPNSEKSIGECIDEYIEIKTNVLSPTTIDNYKRYKKNNLQSVCFIRICDFTSSDAQRLINNLSADLSPKSVRNIYGLLSAVFRVYSPDTRLNVTLPQKQREFREFPEIQTIIKAFRGSVIEIPVLLALWEGLRMSEIRGIKRSDIKDGIMTINTVVVTVNGERIEKKQTKTYTSKRQLRLPKYILDLINALPPEQEYITTLSGHAIYARFKRTLEREGIPHIRFHDLRHLNASAMLALGIPDKYAMERGGWSSPQIMKGTYQHTFSADRNAVDERINAYFSGFLE